MGSLLVLAGIALLCAGSTALVSRPKGPDADLTTPEYIIRHGYPVEVHQVTTEDGYILEQHRIPYSPKSPPAPGKPVVLLVHGSYSSTYFWVILGPEAALPFLLADAGYDVWMVNSRGNTYSRKHTSLSPSSAAFWDYYVHERGVYDLPAMIDSTLRVTRQEKLHYIGYSRGVTMLLIMGAERPEYNAKIKVAVLIAPSAFRRYNNSPLEKFAAHNYAPIEAWSTLAGLYEFTPAVPLKIALDKSPCWKVPSAPYLCEHIFFRVGGYSTKRVNETLMRDFIDHVSNGTTLKEVTHDRQLYVNKRFCKYDYGEKENLLRYGNSTPPDYDLDKVTCPVALVIGDKDQMVLLQDVAVLAPKIPNLVEAYHVPEYDHTDFIFAVDAKPLVYDHVLDLLSKF